MLERKYANPADTSPARFLILPLWLLAIYFMGTLMNEASTICLWIICSFFLFVVLDPIAEYFKAKRWPTALVAVLLVVIATIIIVGTCYMLGYLVTDIVTELQRSKEMFMKTFSTVYTKWNQWFSSLHALQPGSAAGSADVSKVQVVDQSPLGGELGGTILHGVGSVVSVLTFSILVPILTFFLLAERDVFGRVLGKAYRDPSRAALTWRDIVRSTRAFFVGNVILGVISYPLFALLFWLFGVPSVFTVAALATFFNLIPFAGAVLSGFLPALSLYAQSETVADPVGLYGCCILIHFVIADFITPKILGSQVNINATTSTIALVAWGELWGGVGLVLAIPLTALIKTLFEHSDFFWLQWIAGLMSEDVDTALKVPLRRKSNKKA